MLSTSSTSPFFWPLSKALKGLSQNSLSFTQLLGGQTSLLSLFLPAQTFSLRNAIIWLYHRVGSKINFSLLYTPGFFPLSVSCWYFICLYLAEFLSHPQHSQILVLPFFFARCWQRFFEPYDSLRCCFLVPCLCPAIDRQETNPLFWGGKL